MTAPKPAGPKLGRVASVLRKVADGTTWRARSTWTRLMPAPGYRLSDGTGISDLLISACRSGRSAVGCRTLVTEGSAVAGSPGLGLAAVGERQWSWPGLPP